MPPTRCDLSSLWFHAPMTLQAVALSAGSKLLFQACTKHAYCILWKLSVQHVQVKRQCCQRSQNVMTCMVDLPVVWSCQYISSRESSTMVDGFQLCTETVVREIYYPERKCLGRRQ